MKLGLENRRVLITGGNTGLGAAMAVAFASEGARVAVNYVAQPEAAVQVADSLRGRAADVQILEADVSDQRAVCTMFERIDAAWGGLDILVNNAGIDGTRALSWEADPGSWARVLRVNLEGAFLCAREALRRMVRQRAGVILNISSVHERIPWSGYGAYTASKAGLSMLSQTMALEGAALGVRVLCISPGAIRTPINAEAWSNSAGREDLLRKIPVGELGETSDVASLAVVLASDRAAYVTGTSLFVDGGMSNYPEFRHGG